MDVQPMEDGLDRDLLNATKDEDKEKGNKQVPETDEILMDVQPMEDGLERDLLNATMIPKTAADLVVERHMKWTKNKEAEEKQNEGGKEDLQINPDPDLEMVFWEGATRLALNW